MQFWHERFPDRIHDLSYEALTENQEAETRRLLRYVGLDWEDTCVDVQQQMPRDSSDTWRNYEARLGSLLDALDKSDD